MSAPDSPAALVSTVSACRPGGGIATSAMAPASATTMRRTARSGSPIGKGEIAGQAAGVAGRRGRRATRSRRPFFSMRSTAQSVARCLAEPWQTSRCRRRRTPARSGRQVAEAREDEPLAGCLPPRMATWPSSQARWRAPRSPAPPCWSQRGQATSTPLRLAAARLQGRTLPLENSRSCRRIRHRLSGAVGLGTIVGFVERGVGPERAVHRRNGDRVVAACRGTGPRHADRSDHALGPQ